MGDGSSGSFGGFSEFVKDIGGKVGGSVKSGLGTVANTVGAQVTGQTPKQNSQVAGQPPPENAPAGVGFDAGAVFAGEKNAQTSQQSSQQQQQQQIREMATKNKQKDEAGIADVRKRLQALQGQHRETYYDPLVRQIEGKDRSQEKPVAEKLEDEKQQEEAKKFELRQEEKKKELPKSNSRETGKGAKA